jgi:hypothetical protein
MQQGMALRNVIDVGGYDQLAQIASFEQVTKAQDGAFVGQSAQARIDLSELAVKRHIVQGLFHGRIAQAEPLLHKVEARHGLNCKRGAVPSCPQAHGA